MERKSKVRNGSTPGAFSLCMRSQHVLRGQRSSGAARQVIWFCAYDWTARRAFVSGDILPLLRERLEQIKDFAWSAICRHNKKKVKHVRQILFAGGGLVS